MRIIMKIFFVIVITSSILHAQQTSFQDELLDHFTGNWILTGTIGGKETTHEVISEWVLAHQYIQMHETSREKNSNGEPEYEAIVYIGWDTPLKQYSCLWLDVTGGGGLSAQAIGHSDKIIDRMNFLFKESDNSLFHTTFLYDEKSDSWQWLMDNDENGKLQPFARLRMTRK